ncbi:hypothetical protein ACFY8P_28500 [Streptomyces sp. NPDC012693]|jgi:hypothetical protein|uniref:hypothetical protein n=1 Tax=unclassified Streptomyces TaxID=2593676 RepID=UPI00202DF965|nr:hypothetical protein [Streptomyces sp. MSC1_001]
MNTKPACGPQRDPEFFDEIDRVFTKYPEAAERYAVTCTRAEHEVLKIDYSKQVGVSRIEDGRIITEFQDREIERASHSYCCQWKNGECQRICIVQQ